MAIDLTRLVDSLSAQLPSAVRWAGSVARRMRQFNIALESKHSGSASTDALTLADLTVQELLVGALRDGDPLFRQCRIEAEESTGDLARFAEQGEYTIALDPIDGTKQYRDKTGNGYSIILTLRSPETLHYTLVFAPESEPHGSWVEIKHNRIVTGPDDPSRTAVEVLKSIAPLRAQSFSLPPSAGEGRGGGAVLGQTSVAPSPPPQPSPVKGEGAGGRRIYLIGFQKHDRARAELVKNAGLEGVAADDCAGCLYELLAQGKYAGSLIHSPNVYDYPASPHLVRVLGGDSWWVHNQQPVNFHELWLDDRANMLRLPGIVATSPDRDVLKILCNLARDWNPIRYAE